MSFGLTSFAPRTRIVKTRAFTDPAQYDTEINAARGFKLPTPNKPKKTKPTIPIDPAQFDTDENIVRHVVYDDKKPNE